VDNGWWMSNTGLPHSIQNGVTICLGPSPGARRPCTAAEAAGALDPLFPSAEYSIAYFYDNALGSPPPLLTSLRAASGQFDCEDQVRDAMGRV
jgi:hypothetical protein